MSRRGRHRTGRLHFRTRAPTKAESKRDSQAEYPWGHCRHKRLKPKSYSDPIEKPKLPLVGMQYLPSSCQDIWALMRNNLTFCATAGSNVEPLAGFCSVEEVQAGSCRGCRFLARDVSMA